MVTFKLVYAVFQIHLISCGSGSASGITDPTNPNKLQFFSYYYFSLKGIKLLTMFFVVVNLSLILNSIVISFKKNYILKILVDLFFATRIRFLKWIRIRSNDTDPTGSVSETVIVSVTHTL